MANTLSPAERLLFAAANNLNRRSDRALVYAVNRVLPSVMRAGRGRPQYRHVAHVPYGTPHGGPLHVDIYTPTDGHRPYPVVVGFHGGAWVVGCKENLQHLGTAFARRGFMAVNVQYRLAPKHRYPACADDVEAALRWVRAHAHVYGGDGHRVGVFGDSAGGHLSAYAATAVHAKAQHDRTLPRVAAAVHWYGVFDFSKFAKVPWNRTPDILRALFGDEKALDAAIHAAASPRSHVREGAPVPPTLLFCGTRDPLLGQSRGYKKDLDARGIVNELKIYTGSVHGFANFWWQGDGRDSIRRAGEWFRRHLHAPAH